MNITIIDLPYNVEGKNKGSGAGPKALLKGDLVDKLTADGHTKVNVKEIELSKSDETRYGAWRLVGTANNYLADTVNNEINQSNFVLGLLANCNGVIGVLGGLQKGKKLQQPKRVGLIWIDAHGDYNTPNTSPSGMLGGMPVAVSAGKCLDNLRTMSGLNYPLQSPDIVMVGLRDLDSLEQAAIERDNIVTFNETDLINCSDRLKEAIEYLSQREDIIYVHVDLDILDPELAPAAGLPTPGGLSGKQLGESLRFLLQYPKVKALAMVSYKPERDSKDLKTRAEIITAIREGLKGLKDR